MSKSEQFEFTLNHLFLLNDCYRLIEETIEKHIELHTWSFEERQGMLKAIDDAMKLIKEDMPKFKVAKERHLKLVTKDSLES